MSTVTVNGESGGGNLALATCLYAKKLDLLSHIDGVYVQCPMISNLYRDVPEAKALPSLAECNGYVLDSALMDIMACLYSAPVDGMHCTDPLAWPYHATPEDLAGLPPHFISVNELDPVRDEGVAYFRKLQQAGVQAYCKTTMGMTHVGEMLAAVKPLPALHRLAVHDIYQFAASR